MLTSYHDTGGRLWRLMVGFCLFLVMFMISTGRVFLVHGADSSPPELDVGYVPTPHEVVQRMLEMAGVHDDDFVVDLGSGDGRIVVAAIRDFDARLALGIDLDPQRVAEGRESARRDGVEDRTVFLEGDLFGMDFSDATVLTMYLLPALNLRLKPIILKDMAPGTRIVSHAFDMGDWIPDQAEIVAGHAVYLWIVPARVEGDWTVRAPDHSEFALSFTQTFQQIKGHAVINGSRTELTGLRLRGNRILFSIGEDQYIGRIMGDTIVPDPSQEEATDWHARRK
ncbi:Ribosomal protein L11 methyltransferase (PrmA) [Desulfonatronum thiosulfatophilum]|uniref:Ribosomal protein L11 methyltransferase (PrmA) n=1 Tax=Desulfonatronum thiosulfatophilum TaxID=617002 RepID=A0A1G6CS12_9BACT|nr:class I SAM-dependent methyltransferase [Desulfonatronum thiosulfatophilum]SDB35700.1 Ribosomal protein L11 methyltransferase (PrmA) [Desulfonatronum thiosulfatophilum]